ncbi:MAG: hypothetical protein FJX74_13030 [Armatimonadetes bacterium]|nr:hypothetical protein [Armatimonadota bacterium]
MSSPARLLRRNLARLAAALLLTAAVATAHAARGRIAIAGPWGTGYAGLLARYGLPRERLLDPQVADPTVLGRYDVVVLSGAVANWSAAQPVVEQYVRNGGAALLEYSALPSPEAMPGERIGAQGAPNFVLEAANHPAISGLPPGKTYAHNGNPGAAIIPAAGSGTVVLARYTEEGAGEKVRGKFVLNGQSVPAIVYRPLDRGHLVYSGPYMGDVMAFGGGDDDLILALMQFLTSGNAVPRLTLAGPEDLLTLLGWAPPPPAVSAPASPTLPEGYALVEGAPPVFAAYDVQGKVVGPVDLLLDYVAPDRGYQLRLEDGRPASLAPLGAATGAATGPPVALPAGAEVVVARTRGAVSILVNRAEVHQTADAGQWPGAVAAKGLADCFVQPVEPVSFSDDFMQEAGEAAAWQSVSGAWQIVSTEGEASTGANPFSYGVETGEEALATAGEWFWDDYAFEASARWTQNAVGMVFDYRDPANYRLLEADLADQTLELATVEEGKRETRRSVSASLRPWQWYRLAVRSSQGLVQFLLDGEPLGEVQLESDRCGPLGLYARNAKAAFDDVEARPWRVGPSLRDAGWRWSDAAPVAAGDRVTVRGAGRTGEVWGDVSVRVELRMGEATEAGVRVRETAEAACEAVVERTSGGLALKLREVRNGKATVLGATPVSGRRPADPLPLTVKAVRERVFCGIEGGSYLLRAAVLPAEGAVGVFANGKGAQFGALDIRPGESGLYRADPPTPAYAGAVDVMTWAGTAFSWAPDPSDLELFWHEGDVPGPLRVRVGVHRGEAAEAVAEVRLAPSDASAGSGYAVRFAHTWDTPLATVAVTRGGADVAKTTYAGPLMPTGYLAEVEKAGSALTVRVNGSPVLACGGTQADTDGRRVGVKLQGATLCYDDLLLERTNVRTYTFNEAPSDWLVQRGTWEVTSRWTCSPGWTWLSGLSDRHAMVQSKWPVEGDVLVDTFVGPKMMQTAEGRKEVLNELRLGLCGRTGYLNAGYCFLVGAKGGAWTAIQRDGVVVAETSDFVVPQGGVHNDWVQFSARKRGNEVALLCRGQVVLSYTDPDPLPGGRVSFGAYNNGLMFPRVTVYGAVTGLR